VIIERKCLSDSKAAAHQYIASASRETPFFIGELHVHPTGRLEVFITDSCEG
jgi:hypothetical protein